MRDFITPIVLIIYKRDSTLKLIIEELRKINARKIYVIADGKKSENEKDEVNKTRLIIESIDWNPSIIKRYSEKNIGLQNNVLNGLDFVFENEEKAIILEDDCIPNTSFFYFASEMLQTYENHNQILMVAGTSIISNLSSKYHYEFSSFPFIWGWGTWKSRWKDFRSIYPLNFDRKELDIIKNLLQDRVAYFHWTKLFFKIRNGSHSSWDHELIYYSFIKNKFCIIPNINMISNHGLDIKATHTTKLSTKKSSNKYFFSKVYELKEDLVHPPMIKNKRLDKKIQKKIYSGGLRNYISYFLQKYLLGIFVNINKTIK